MKRGDQGRLCRPGARQGRQRVEEGQDRGIRWVGVPCPVGCPAVLSKSAIRLILSQLHNHSLLPPSKEASPIVCASGEQVITLPLPDPCRYPEPKLS